jgi:hypothetical protein
MPRFVEQIKFLVFREQDGRWQIVGEHSVQTMAEEHLRDLKRGGYQAGMLRVRTRGPHTTMVAIAADQEGEA